MWTTELTVQEWSTAPLSLHSRVPQRSLPHTGDQPDLTKGFQGYSQPEPQPRTWQKEENFPKVAPKRGTVPVRTREERVCGDTAIAHESGCSQLSPCPLPSPVTGRRHLALPSSAGGGTSCPSLPACWLWLEALGIDGVVLKCHLPEIPWRNAGSTVWLCP